MQSFIASEKRNCILLIDDDAMNRAILRNIFCDSYTFEEAGDGRQGLELVEQCRHKLCAILLDVNMPRMSGLEMLTILAQRDLPSQIPVFLITAEGEESIAREAYSLGAMDVIEKPVTPFVVRRRVDSVVELFQARDVLSSTVRSQDRELRQNAHTIDALHKGTIEALAAAIEFRDVESGEHTSRIYGITKLLLSKTELGAGFTQEEIENMAIGSIMHDVGKIAVSDLILNKPGKLNSQEYEAMKLHTVKGGILMEQLCRIQSHPSYEYAVDIARHHHERYDGRGYPDGLKGSEITPWSQAVSVADVYDALMTPRVYKRAYSPDRAREMIVNGECGVFGPRLLECFLQVEPELRRLYAGEDRIVPQLDRAIESASQRSDPVADMLLMISAIRAAYDMVIFANLTRNTYRMIDYDNYLNHTAANDGVFDELIAAGASTVPPEDRAVFQRTFCRDTLLHDYDKGHRAVSLIHHQWNDSGEDCLVETRVLLMKDDRTGDILDLTFSRPIENYLEIEE